MEMTEEILKAAEENAMNYCIQRGLAKAAFLDGALWALRQSKELLEKLKSELDTECHEEEV